MQMEAQSDIEEPIEAQVLVDTDKYGINTADFVITYDTSLLTFEYASISGSIFSIFQAVPQEISPGKIRICAAAPLSFIGTRGPIASLFFTPKESGETVLAFSELVAYQDGGIDPYSVTSIDLIGRIHLASEQEGVEPIVLDDVQVVTEATQEKTRTQTAAQRSFFLFLILLILIMIAIMAERENFWRVYHD